MKKNETPATAHVIHETRWPNTKQIYKLKLMVTHKRVQKFYTIIIPGVPATLSVKDFEKIKQDKPRKPFSDYRDLINQVEINSRQVITNMQEFSFDKFEKNYFEPAIDEKSLFAAIESYMAELTHQGSVGTASSYKCALVSLKKFTGEKGITFMSFNDVTVEFLNEWEAWMRKHSVASATIGIYCRNVRTILNKAIDAGLLKQDDYPFGRNKFIPPTGQNIKKALTVEDVGKIFNYKVIPDSPEHRARDLWIFSYLCNGINIKDIARLKYKNIDFESISFIRAKTLKSQRSNQKNITVPLSKEVLDIIEKWGNKPAVAESYVFPILFEGVSPLRERVLVQQATKTTNKYVKRIATAAGIQSVTTTYTARHSFATVMKRSGASTEFISESLGHSNLSTTENYLASFEMETKRNLAKNLMNFE